MSLKVRDETLKAHVEDSMKWYDALDDTSQRKLIENMFYERIRNKVSKTSVAGMRGILKGSEGEETFLIEYGK